jgi:4-carboxymuconolactone decarboxylase
MKNIIKEAPLVSQAFFDLTKSIRQHSLLEEKVNELIILGIFTSHNSPRGISTHVGRAMHAGASKNEIISAILLALPISGVTNVNLAIDQALQSISEFTDLEEIEE